MIIAQAMVHYMSQDDDLDEIFIAHIMNMRKYLYARHLKGHQC